MNHDCMLASGAEEVNFNDDGMVTIIQGSKHSLFKHSLFITRKIDTIFLVYLKKLLLTASRLNFFSPLIQGGYREHF